MSNTSQPAHAISACAIICHETNRALCQTQGDYSQKPWPEAEAWQRESAMAGVHTVLNAEDAEISDGMLHDAWSAHKRAEGWVYGIEKNADLKTHPCLVPHDQLPEAQQVKDRLFLAVVRAYFALAASH